MKLHVISLTVIVFAYHVLTGEAPPKSRGRYGITYGTKADHHPFFARLIQ